MLLKPAKLAGFLSYTVQKRPTASRQNVSKIVSNGLLELRPYSLNVTHMLTDTKLRALKPRESVYRIADASGLCVEVRPTGAKLWRYRYRYTGKARMLALGEYPSVSLMDARGKLNEARAVLAAGIDPTVNAKAKREAVIERASNTFAALAHEWLAQNAHAVTPGTQRRDRRVFERHLNPWIGNTAITEVSPPMLLAALRRIESAPAPWKQRTEHAGSHHVCFATPSPRVVPNGIQRQN
jgi:hypothetical protein